MAVARRIRCAVEGILGLGGGVYVVDLKPESAVPLFKAGQFLHLTLDEYSPSKHWPESRAFSMASSPDDRRTIQICYSVKGRYTSRMERELKTGGSVWIKLPFGDFFIDATQDVVLLAGGTGISAFSAFIGNLRPDHSHDVMLAYGVRTPAQWLFQDLVLRQLQAVPRFRASFGCEQADSTLPPIPTGLAKRLDYRIAARIELDRIFPQLTNPAEYCFYLSGPPAMLKALAADLKARGIEPGRIRTDAWE